MGFLDNYNALVNKPKIPGADNLAGAIPSSISTQTSTPQTTQFGTGDVLKTVGQGIARETAALGAAIKGIPEQTRALVTNTPVDETSTSFTPAPKGTFLGNFQQAVYGTDQPISLESIGEEYGAKPVSEGGSGFNPTLVGLTAGILNLATGGGTKGLSELTKLVTKAKTVEDVLPLLKNAGIADDIAEQYAPLLSTTNKAKEVEEALLSAERLQNTTKLVEPQTLIDETLNPLSKVDTGVKEKSLTYFRENPEEIAKSPIEVRSTEQGLSILDGRHRLQVADELGIPVRVKDVTEEFSDIAPELRPLAEEARKYKSAEEFVSKQPVVYHGSPVPLKSFSNKKGGVFFTRSMEDASGFAGTPDNVYEGFLNFKKPLVIDAKGAKWDALDTKYGKSTQEVISNAKKDGYDGVVFNNIIDNIADDADAGIPDTIYYAYKPEDSFINESQLTDFYNRITTDTGATLQKETLEKLPEGMRAFKENIPQGASTFKRMWTNIVENVQNTEERIRQLVETKGLDTTVDPYERLTLYHGRVGQKIEEGYDLTEDIADDVITFSGRSRGESIDGRTAVNKYLQALHAPERNAALGDGAAGITTKEALQITKETPEEVRKIAEKVLDLNRKSLDMLKESGVISEELHTTLRTKYKNHVPLQRIFEGEDDFGSVLAAGGFDVRGTGIKSAKGSERQVADIISNVVHNYEQAVLRSEKNIVDNAALAFVRNNEEQLKDIVQIRKPKVIGQTSEGAPLFERTNDPRILQFFEDGKRTFLEFEDTNLAIAFRGVGKEKMPAILNWVGNFTRFYSGLATRFNPEFALPNKIRDLQEVVVYMASQKDIRAAGAFQTASKDAASIKQIAKALLDPNSADSKLYNEMKNLGGTTGGMGLSTRKQTELNVDKIFDTARSKPRKAAAQLIEYVDNWNTIFEDSTRLSVYKQAIAQGATKERAAFLAKEASINFNRFGKGGPVINALYMFANASIQGSFKMVRALKDPKVAAGVAATMASAVGAVNAWNNRIA